MFSSFGVDRHADCFDPAERRNVSIAPRARLPKHLRARDSADHFAHLRTQFAGATTLCRFAAVWRARSLAAAATMMPRRLLALAPAAARTAILAPVPARASGVDYAGIEHPKLASADGRTLAISYFHPLSGLAGELLLVRVTLA
jgi:hypothetical protein